MSFPILVLAKQSFVRKKYIYNKEHTTKKKQIKNSAKKKRKNWFIQIQDKKTKENKKPKNKEKKDRKMLHLL